MIKSRCGWLCTDRRTGGRGVFRVSNACSPRMFLRDAASLCCSTRFPCSSDVTRCSSHVFCCSSHVIRCFTDVIRCLDPRASFLRRLMTCCRFISCRLSLSAFSFWKMYCSKDTLRCCYRRTSRVLLKPPERKIEVNNQSTLVEIEVVLNFDDRLSLTESDQNYGGVRQSKKSKSHEYYVNFATVAAAPATIGS